MVAAPRAPTSTTGATAHGCAAADVAFQPGAGAQATTSRAADGVPTSGLARAAITVVSSAATTYFAVAAAPLELASAAALAAAGCAIAAAAVAVVAAPACYSNQCL